MQPKLICPSCGSNAVFHSRRRRADGFLRPLVFSAARCHMCGHRHFRVNPLAVAVMAGFLAALATFIGAGEMAWKHHAGLKSRPLAQAQTVTRGT
jgi:hypothetical protein